jgi:hypothetical protein
MDSGRVQIVPTWYGQTFEGRGPVEAPTTPQEARHIVLLAMGAVFGMELLDMVQAAIVDISGVW